MNLTSWLDSNVLFGFRLRCILLNIGSYKKCKSCSALCKTWNNRKKDFCDFCSRKCSNSFKKKIRKAKETRLKKYGNANYNNREKSIQTCLKKYGVEHYLSSVESRSKIRETCLKKGNGKYYNNMEKNFETCLKKYGSFSSQSHISKEVLQKLNDKNFLETEHIHNQKSLTCIALELGVSLFCVRRYLKLHDIDVNYYFFSQYEKEICNFIKIYYDGLLLTNVRDVIFPKELDVYLPDLNLAIEFHGLYWHSFDYKETAEEKKYHYNKRAECKEHNIQLLQIFEDEWLDPNKKDIWKSLILNKLNVCKTKIYARNCLIEEIDNNVYKDFCNENHLQGFSNAKIRLGLFYQNELIFVMSFSKSRYDKKFEYELIRLCSKKYFTIIGGASKLLSYFIKKYSNSLVSYCDLRYSNGEVYKKLGFTFSHISPPNYFYVYNNERKGRLEYQKHKLVNKLNIFDENLTESQNMFNNGFRRIWDAGNICYYK